MLLGQWLDIGAVVIVRSYVFWKRIYTHVGLLYIWMGEKLDRTYIYNLGFIYIALDFSHVYIKQRSPREISFIKSPSSYTHS